MTLDTGQFCFGFISFLLSPLSAFSLRWRAGEALEKTCDQFNLSNAFLGVADPQVKLVSLGGGGGVTWPWNPPGLLRTSLHYCPEFGPSELEALFGSSRKYQVGCRGSGGHRQSSLGLAKTPLCVFCLCVGWSRPRAGRHTVGRWLLCVG